jgi:lipopolysaccharide export system permease protein
MTILRIFLAKEWFKSFIATFIILIILVAAADIINAFMRNKGDFLTILFNFSVKAPELLSKLLPFASLLATVFAINKLKTHSELIAILAAGMGPLKILQVFIFCGSLLAILQFINTGYVIPYANQIKLSDDEEQFVRSSINSGKIWYRGNNYFANFTGYEQSSNRIIDLTLIFHNNQFLISNIISARYARYMSENIWQLEDGVIKAHLDLKEFPTIERFKLKPIELTENPSDFKKFESDIATLDIFNLSSYITRLEKNGIQATQYKMIMWDKISLSFICFLFTLMPLLGIFNPNRRSSSFGKSVLFTLVFMIVYWLAHTSIIALGNNQQLPPFVAAFLMPFIFTIFLIHQFTKHRQL